MSVSKLAVAAHSALIRKFLDGPGGLGVAEPLIAAVRVEVGEDYVSLRSSSAGAKTGSFGVQHGSGSSGSGDEQLERRGLR